MGFSPAGRSGRAVVALRGGGAFISIGEMTEPYVRLVGRFCLLGGWKPVKGPARLCPHALADCLRFGGDICRC